MTDTETEKQIQAEGEAGSMQGAPRGTRSRVSRTRPWPEGSAKPLGHWGCPPSRTSDPSPARGGHVPQHTLQRQPVGGRSPSSAGLQQGRCVGRSPPRLRHTKGGAMSKKTPFSRGDVPAQARVSARPAAGPAPIARGPLLPPSCS